MTLSVEDIKWLRRDFEKSAHGCKQVILLLAINGVTDQLIGVHALPLIGVHLPVTFWPQMKIHPLKLYFSMLFNLIFACLMETD